MKHTARYKCTQSITSVSLRSGGRSVRPERASPPAAAQQRAKHTKKTNETGSHTVLVLLEHGYRVTMIDNLSNSFLRVYEHMKRLAGPKAGQMAFVQADLRDKAAVDQLFADNKFDAVIHFAGFKAVGESVDKPLEYYDNNFVASVVLLEVMRKHEVFTLVFSSSCTVYGLPDETPITEAAPLAAISPYGRTKLFQEDMFRYRVLVLVVVVAVVVVGCFC